MDWIDLPNFIILVGSILGWFSFILLLDKWLRERPILSFRFGRINHGYIDKEKRNVFGLNMKIIVDNTGERGTTITNIEFVSVTPEEYYKELKKIKSTWERDIPPHCTRHIDNNLNIEDYKEKVKKEDIISGKLKISWTHASRPKIIPFISKIQK